MFLMLLRSGWTVKFNVLDVIEVRSDSKSLMCLMLLRSGRTVTI